MTFFFNNATSDKWTETEKMEEDSFPTFVSTSDSLRSAYKVDGVLPSFIARPKTPEECITVVRWASGKGFALLPCGGGTALGQGNLLKASCWGAVCTAAFSRIEDFSPDDMVVTVQAGCTLQALQEVLAVRGQFLPIDAPIAERATLGGIVATNAQGLWRPAFGAPRDRLLGVRVVMADGSVVHGGGKVVKNVAGYDLCKLFAGSWGTLGIITEVTFKTNPRPEAHAHIAYAAPSIHTAVEAALQIHAARLQPIYATAVSMPDSYLCIGLMGNAQTVEWQDKEITHLVESYGLQRSESGPSEDTLRHCVVRSSAELSVRFIVRSSELLGIAQALEGRAERFVCHVPTGIAEATFTYPTDLDPMGSAQGAEEWLRSLVPAGGHLIWLRLPTAWKTEIDIWGPARGDFHLMKGIKSSFDPNGLFSPGRFVGRL